MQFIELEGSPSQQGLAHGEHFRKEIKELAALRLEILHQRFWLKATNKDRIELAKKMIVALQKYPQLYDEFSGIAEGAAVSPEDLMVLNNYTDMRDFPVSGDPDTHGCSTLSWRLGSQHICGQTWDMHASARPYVLHMKVHADPKNRGEPVEPTEVLTLTGCLGLAGINQSQVAVMINNMHGLDSKVSIMWPALVRLLLKQKTAAQALDTLQKNLPCSGRNYLICDEKESINVETSATKAVVTTRLKGDGVVFHTNHYVDPELSKLENKGRQSKTTHPRYEALEKYFASEQGRHLSMQQIGEDVFAGKKAESICVRLDPKDPHSAMTCGGLLLNFATGEGISFAGQWNENDDHRFVFAQRALGEASD